MARETPIQEPAKEQCEKVQHDGHEGGIIALFSFLRRSIVCLRVKVQDVDYEIESSSARHRVRGEVPGSTRSISSYQGAFCTNEDRYLRLINE